MNITWLGTLECHDVKLVGGKAASLSRFAADHLVPPGFVLTTQAFATTLNGHTSLIPEMPSNIAFELETAYSHLAAQRGEAINLAVRSSAVDEDGDSDSFAGQHETYLNITSIDGVKEAVRLCWESAFSERAIAYRRERGLASDSPQLAVLVQELVHSDVSAVVFTTNPITGNEDEIVVTASWGLGESVVGGTVTPDTHIFRKLDLRLVSQQIGEKERMTVRLEDGTKEVSVPRMMRSRPALSDEQAVEMAGLGLSLEEKMGRPVDVECSYQGDQLYLLQCRPITTLTPPQETEGTPIDVPAEFPVVWKNPDDQKLHWRHDTVHHPNAMTPLESDYQRLMDGIARGGAFYGTSWSYKSLVFNGYLYGAGVPEVLPESVEGRTARSDEKMSAVARDLGGMWEREWYPEIRSLLAAWDRYDLSGASMPELLKHLDETMTRARDLWFLHFRLIWPVLLAMDVFAGLYQDLFEDADSFAAMTLLQGFGNKTVESGHALWRLSRVVLDTPQLLGVFRSCPAPDILSALRTDPAAEPFLKKMDAYLEVFGERGDLWGLSAVSWIEDPTPAIKGLINYIAQPERDPVADLARLADERERAVAAARKQLDNFPTPIVESFDLWLNAAQTAAVLLEDHGFWIDYSGVYKVRRVFLEFGSRFVRAGALKDPGDIFFLHLDELRTAAAELPNGDYRSLVSLRKSELSHYEQLDPPGFLGTDSGTTVGGQLMHAMKNFRGVAQTPSGEPGILNGNAGSAGIVRGTARVLQSIGEVDRMRPGDILIARTTTPDWTPLFVTAAGVVTDTGGILSHCAVVAREYAIPAVVGVGNATEVIKDGQELEVDGNRGVVRVLEAG